MFFINKQMSNNISRAKTANVLFGNYTIVCVQMPDGSFRVPVTEVYMNFNDNPACPENASKMVKALLPKDSPPVQKVASVLNSNPVNTISLSQFEQVVSKLATNKNQKAITFVMSLFGTNLEQKVEEAFGITYNAKREQMRLAARQEGIEVRNVLTDAIKTDLQNKQYSLMEEKFIYKNITDLVYKELSGMNAKQLKTVWNVDDIRESLERKSLMLVKHYEWLISKEMEINPSFKAYDAAKSIFTKYPTSERLIKKT